MAIVVEEIETTRVEAIVAAHACRWVSIDEFADEGRCRCGEVVTTEGQWAAHTDAAIIAELWTPAAQVVSAVSDLAALPMRSAILVRPGRENVVFRRLSFWLIVGGKSGQGYRPLDLDWVRDLRDRRGDVPFYFKQVGGRTPKAGGRTLDGQIWDEFPAAAADLVDA